MSSFVFVQPNGKLGRFSSISGRVSDWDCTVTELSEFYQESMSKRDANKKVLRGVRDENLAPYMKVDGRPYYRLRQALLSCCGANINTYMYNNPSHAMAFEMGLPEPWLKWASEITKINISYDENGPSSWSQFVPDWNPEEVTEISEESDLKGLGDRR